MTVVLSDQRLPSDLRFVALRRSVSDLQRSAAFYCDGLGFQRANSTPGETVLHLGAQRIVLMDGGPAASVQGVSGPDLRFAHVAIVTDDMHAAFARMRALSPVAISNDGPQRLPAASGGVCAFKFRDPDGRALELIEFPQDKLAQYWQAAARRYRGPTLGIDHAAISVANVARSVAFYEQLGLSLQSAQLNQGVEQARLDGLDVAEVDVVAMAPLHAETPHLELLAYRKPEPVSGGMQDSATADRLIWQSQQIDGSSRFGGEPPRTRVVTDPDGHLHEIIA